MALMDSAEGSIMELTRRVIDLYDDIQTRIVGRFAMWPQDAQAWYDINFESMGATLEIGTAWGGSAILARKAKEDAFRDNSIYTIDPLGGFYGKGKPDKMSGSFPTVEIVERNFERMDIRLVKYARAMFDPIFTVKKDERDSVLIELNTEVEGLDIYYSFDNSHPDNYAY